MKKLFSGFLFVAAITAVRTLHAQVVPSIEWQKCLGGSYDDEAYCIEPTSDGCFIVAGKGGSQDGDILENHGVDDFWIVKLDTHGSIVWQKSLGGSSYDQAYFIQQTNDDGFIIAGRSASNDGEVSGNHGDQDYWIVKLDPDGNLVWQKSYGGSDSDNPYSVQQTADGGFIVAGLSPSNDGNVTGNHGQSDYWIVKLDAGGNLEWQKSLGGSGNDFGYSVQQTAEGGFIVAGFSLSNDGDVSGHHYSYYETFDYWIIRLDTVGNIVWQKSLGGSDNEQAYSVQQTADGGFIIAGYSKSNDGDVSGNHGQYDYWIVKLDTDGILEWQKSLGGSESDFAYSIQNTNNGFLVTGYTWSNDGDVSGNHGGFDYWVVKLDTDGNIVWQKSLGGSSGDFAYSAKQITDSSFVIAGYTYSDDGDVSGRYAAYDYWIVKLSTDTLTGIASPSNNFISISPNPVQAQLTLTLRNPENDVTIRVYDLQGRIIALQITFTSEEVQLNTTSLADGFYTLEIVNNKTGIIEVGKFVKQVN